MRADGKIELLQLPRGTVFSATTERGHQFSVVLGEETPPVRVGYGVGRVVTASPDWSLTSACFGRLGAGSSIHPVAGAGDVLFQGTCLLLEDPTGPSSLITIRSIAVLLPLREAA